MKTQQCLQPTSHHTHSQAFSCIEKNCFAIGDGFRSAGEVGWLRGAACGSHSRGRRSGSGLRGRSSGRERRPLAPTACWRQAVFCRCRRQTRRGMQIRGSFPCNEEHMAPLPPLPCSDSRLFPPLHALRATRSSFHANPPRWPLQPQPTAIVV